MDIEENENVCFRAVCWKQMMHISKTMEMIKTYYICVQAKLVHIFRRSDDGEINGIVFERNREI